MSVADTPHVHRRAFGMTGREDLRSARGGMRHRALALVTGPLNPVRPGCFVADVLPVPDTRARAA